MRTWKALPMMFLLGAAWSSVCRGQEKKSPSSQPSSDDKAAIRRLIDRLGSDDFRVREEATRKLKALGEKALPQVEKAVQSADAEVRRRAQRIAAHLREQKRQRVLREILAEASFRPIDRAIERMAMRAEFDKPENWERFIRLADAMTQRASQLGGKRWTLPDVDFRKFPTISDGPEGGLLRRQLRVDSKIRLDGCGHIFTSIHRCFLVSSGTIPRFRMLTESIVFVNGDLLGCSAISNSFVFCNGDIGRVAAIRDSVILATGDIQGSSNSENSFFQVKSVMRQRIARGNVYLNLDEVRCARSVNNQFPRSKKGPLQIVKFFDPSALGIAFSQSGEQVRIVKVREGEAFARASLRAGDVVLRADTNEISSAEELRKFLRCRLPGEEFVLTVRRGKKIVETKVKLKD